MKYLLSLFLSVSAFGQSNWVFNPSIPEAVPAGYQSYAAYATGPTANYIAAGGSIPVVGTNADVEIARFQCCSTNVDGLWFVQTGWSTTATNNPEYARWWSGQQAAWNYGVTDGAAAIDIINTQLHQTNDVEVLSGYHQDWKNIVRAQSIGALPSAILLKTNAVYQPLVNP